MWNETITIYTDTKRLCYHGCFVKDVRERNAVGSDFHYATAYRVRIPITTREFDVGSLVFFGDVNFMFADKKGQRANDYLNQYGGFVIKTVADNTRAGFLRHVLIEGF